MSRARELAKAGGVQQRIAGFSSHVGMSTFLAAVHMENNLVVDGNTNVGGNLTVTGTTTFNGGTLTLGDANTDNVVFGGEVDSNIIPDDDNSFDLGSSSKEWKDLYVDGVAYLDSVESDGGSFGNIQIGETGDNEIDTGSGNLTIDSAGGTVTVDDNLTVAGTVTLNTPLANSNLANDSVSFGGVSVDLGSSDATPAFDLQDATGLPISSGVSGLGGNVATFLGTPSSANLRSALTDETGTGNAVFSASPTLTGTVVAANLDISGDIDVDGVTNLDIVDIDGSINVASTSTLGGSLIVTGLSTFSSSVTIAGALDANGGASIDNVQIGVTNDNEIDTSSGNLVIDSSGGTVTVDDNLTVSGNLTVNGTTTTINSTTVAIDDKNFQVATGAADDTAADGAGLTVDSGDGDKTFNFEATGDNWGASENLNLASGKVYKINNSEILSASALSSNVTVPNGSIPDSGVSAGSYGGSTAIPIITVDAKGFVTSASTTSIDSTTIENGSASVSVASNGPITSNANHDFSAGIDVTGNITVSGTVDGADVASMNSKLSGIEAGATGDQTASEIRALVESASDSNVFTDADHSKLNSIEASATGDQTASEILTLIKTVDGAGSGLDADTLDGISSASFLRSDESDTFSGTLTVSGNILPNANGTRDLGASGTRWANVYSSDLDLSNQAKGANSVDGTWGSYLIEEGEDHLFLTNRRSGKKYRFVLEEV